MFIGVCGTKTAFKHCETGIKSPKTRPGPAGGAKLQVDTISASPPTPEVGVRRSAGFLFHKLHFLSPLHAVLLSSTSVQQRQHDPPQRPHLVMEMILLYLETSETPPSSWGGKKISNTVLLLVHLSTPTHTHTLE